MRSQHVNLMLRVYGSPTDGSLRVGLALVVGMLQLPVERDRTTPAARVRRKPIRMPRCCALSVEHRLMGAVQQWCLGPPLHSL